jgi:hypothetical protein
LKNLYSQFAQRIWRAPAWIFKKPLTPASTITPQTEVEMYLLALPRVDLPSGLQFAIVEAFVNASAGSH